MLYEKRQIGVDAFNKPMYVENPVLIRDVIVAPSTTDDIVTSTNLVGKKALYTLGIPKGDTHQWEDVKVEFMGKIFRTFGFTIEGIEENIPLNWHKKVMCERYE